MSRALLLATIAIAAASAALACTDLPFGAPCDVDADCAKDFVCVDDACVPEDDASEGEGEAGEGEGEGGEGEGEGEGELPGVAHVTISHDPELRYAATSIAVSGQQLAVAFAHETFPIDPNWTVELCRMDHIDASPDCLIVDADTGQGSAAQWTSVVLDDSGTAWLIYNQPTADFTGQEAQLVAYDAGGTVTFGPTVLASGSGASIRHVGARSPGGDPAFVVRDPENEIRYYAGPAFDGGQIVMNATSGESGIERVALAFEDDGDAHVATRRHVDADVAAIHAFQDGGGGFTIETIEAESSVGTYISLAFDATGVLHAAYDVEFGFDFYQCVNAKIDGAWHRCDDVPVDFNTHDSALVVLPGGDLALAYRDESASTVAFARGEPGAFTTGYLDEFAVAADWVSAAQLADGRMVVAYGAAPLDDDLALKLAIPDL